MADTSRSPVERLDAALAALEAAVMRIVASERSRTDLLDTLAVMDDDRQRLASDLDAALARGGRLEAAADDVAQRIRAVDDRLGTLLRAPG